MTEYERPNTVSGLVAKHKEPFKLREQHREEIKRLTTGIEHIEECILLFDAKANVCAMREQVMPNGQLAYCYSWDSGTSGSEFSEPSAHA